MSRGITHSIAEPALRAVLAHPVAGAAVQSEPYMRFGLVRVERVPEQAPAEAVRLNFHSYYVVELTNSMAGWCVVSTMRIE
jgi:hypothetical protein